jgi:hypothetical protein
VNNEHLENLIALRRDSADEIIEESVDMRCRVDPAGEAHMHGVYKIVCTLPGSDGM